MGSFYVNFAVAGSDPNAVMDFLESNRRNAFVFSRPNSTTLFFDAEADRQDAEAMGRGRRTRRPRERGGNLLQANFNRREYDLIDAPPRASTGAINAYLASHAVVVPTVLDLLSVDTVGRFLDRMSRFRTLNPCLEQVLVVANLTKMKRLNSPETEAYDQVRLSLARWHGHAHLMSTTLRHYTALGEAAGRNIGYIENSQVREIFDTLGNELSAKLKL